MLKKLDSFSWKLGRFFGFIIIFLLPDAFCTYKCYTYSESYGSKEHSGNLTLMSWVKIKLKGILSSLRTQIGPWSDTFSYGDIDQMHTWYLSFLVRHHVFGPVKSTPKKCVNSRQQCLSSRGVPKILMSASLTRASKLWRRSGKFEVMVVRMVNMNLSEMKWKLYIWEQCFQMHGTLDARSLKQCSMKCAPSPDMSHLPLRQPQFLPARCARLGQCKM